VKTEDSASNVALSVFAALFLRGSTARPDNNQEGKLSAVHCLIDSRSKAYKL
jgi:hypothetical protein